VIRFIRRFCDHQKCSSANFE